MKSHYCKAEREHIAFEGECNWCGMTEAEAPATVAKIGQRIHAADPLPPTTWRARLGDLARALVFCSAGMALGFAIVLVVTGGKA